MTVDIAIPSRARLWAQRGALTTGTSTVAFAIRFSRTLLLAKMLSPAEFGIAMALSAVIGAAEVATDTGHDKFALLHEGAAAEQARGALHLLLLVRGAILVLVLFALAAPLAGLFGVPASVGSFRLVALVPLCRAPMHVDVLQQQRDYRFGGMALVTMVSQFGGLAGTVLGILWLADNRAILLGFVIESLTRTVCTHAWASTAYRLRTDRAMLWAAFRFALPLMANGVGLAAISQADRLLIGGLFGVETLARYSLLLTIAVVPIGLLFSSFGTVSVIALNRVRQNTNRHRHTTVLITWTFAVLAAGYAFGMALLLDVSIRLLFGASYAVGPGLQALAALITLMRVLRGGAPTAILLNETRTGPLAAGNILLGVGLVAAYALAHVWPTLEVVLVGVAVGDALALLVLQGWAVRTMPSVRAAMFRSTVAALGATLLTVAVLLALPEPAWTSRGAVLLAGLAGIAPACIGLARAWSAREAA